MFAADERAARSETRAPAARGTSQLTLELEREVRAPAIARAAVAERCAALGVDSSLAQSLILLVSEVVSNAVRHSTGDPAAPIRMRATFAKRTIRVAVTDAGEGFTPRRRDPSRRHGGYGLYLLEKVSERWGVDVRGDTTVWFELAR